MGRDSIAQGAKPWVAIQQESLALKGAIPNGGIILAPKRESRPVGAFRIISAIQPRAAAPWAIESRPLGALSSTSSRPHQVLDTSISDSSSLQRQHLQPRQPLQALERSWMISTTC